MTDQLADSAERLFTAHCGKEILHAAEDGTWPLALWDAVEEAGFCAALLPEEAGGFGISVPEAFGLLRVAARHAAPIPLAETMLSGWLFARAGMAVPAGILTLAPVRRNERLTLTRAGADWRLSGTATRVPWGRKADAAAVLAAGPDGPMLVKLAQGAFTVTPGANLAAEPRDTITIDAEVAAADAVPWPFPAEALRLAGAAVRTAQIAGALARVLEMSVQYAQTRVQFGRPIGKFQAIQHNLAILAGQSAAALAASDMAADAFGELTPMIIAAAKARAGEAASIAAGLAHQAHGAIGFTQEYELHYATRRLWSWRDEFGTEAEWNALVGRAALAAGGDGLWPAITAAG
ncbi:MAG TPA: acyl-CoA dehydrogenase family protein [Aliidongia sp.]|nr:acyl-CoA dehydrogenase family protein [Aliidongia sp.]